MTRNFAPAAAPVGNGRTRRRFDSGILLAVFLATCLWLVFQVPSPVVVLIDSDAGHQITGAQQILVGEQPYIDWRTTYGPLVFYASAVARALAGNRLIGEMLLCLLGYAASYTLLFAIIRRLGGQAVVALLATALALLLLPRYYKYYLFLAPLLTLYCVLRYVETPRPWRLAAVGAAVAVSGLFRSDFGGYALVAALTGVAVTSLPDLRRFFSRALTLAAAVITAASPWIVLLLWRGCLWTYLQDSVVRSMEQASGMALPIPVIHVAEPLTTAHNLEAEAFVLWYALAAAGVAGLALCWRRCARVLRRQLAVAVVLAAVCMGQSMHRSGLGHLLQAIAVAHVVLALAAAAAWRLATAQPRRLSYAAAGWAGLAALALLALVTVAAGIRTGTLTTPDRHGPYWLTQYYARQPDRFLARVLREIPAYPPARILARIPAYCPVEDRLLAVPYAPQYNYLTGRLFGAGQMLIAPGNYCRDSDQQSMIRDIQSRGCALIIERPMKFDGKTATDLASFPRLAAFVKANYRVVDDPGLPEGVRFWVFRDAGRPADAGDSATNGAPPIGPGG